MKNKRIPMKKKLFLTMKIKMKELYSSLYIIWFDKGPKESIFPKNFLTNHISSFLKVFTKPLQDFSESTKIFLYQHNLLPLSLTVLLYIGMLFLFFFMTLLFYAEFAHLQTLLESLKEVHVLLFKMAEEQAIIIETQNAIIEELHARVEEAHKDIQAKDRADLKGSTAKSALILAFLVVVLRALRQNNPFG